MKKLNIMMLSLHGYVSSDPELGKPDTGGQVTFVLELGKRFSGLGCQVDLVTRQFENQIQVEIINSNFRIIRIPFGGSSFIRKEDMHDYLDEFIDSFLLFIKDNQLNYDIINSHYWDAGWVGQRISEELEINHVFTPHSLGWWKRDELNENEIETDMKLYRFDERIAKEFRVVQSCDLIIATTHSQKDVLTNEYEINDRYIKVIPPGIAEQKFYPLPKEERDELRKKYDFKPHDILLMGRLAENKGYDLMIKSISLLQKQIPDIRVIMALGGKDSKQDIEFIDYLKKVADSEKVSEIIEWRSYIPDEELAHYYRSAAAFVMPSRYEPFGMVAVEAMACGTPTIITRNGALHENLKFGKHALFVDPEDPVEMAAMISLTLKHEDLVGELATEGSRIARKKFGWTGIAKSTIDIFDSLVYLKKMTIEEDID